MADQMQTRGSVAEVFGAFLRLGLTSFGGPVAHLGYFREELVTRRRWLSEQDYAELVALCQFLPGPSSSQISFALGLMRAGWVGALAASLAFTLPTWLILFGLASGAALPEGPLGLGALHGLKLVAVAIVAQAVLGMARSLCPDAPRATIAVLAVAALALIPATGAMVVVIVIGALIGLALPRPAEAPARGAAPGVLPGVLSGVLAARLRPATGLAALVLALALLVLLPFLADRGPAFAMADIFYRAGTLVFGGGHVVLPLLEASLVPQGRVSADSFLAGYALTQAMPGPLFTFSAWLGAVQTQPPHGFWGAALATVAIFLPGFLLLIAALPFWARLAGLAPMRAMMRGANAAVVGVLGAALYHPVFTSAVGGMADFALALACFVALTAWRAPPWLVVMLGALGGMALTLI